MIVNGALLENADLIPNIFNMSLDDIRLRSSSGGSVETRDRDVDSGSAVLRRRGRLAGSEQVTASRHCPQPCASHWVVRKSFLFLGDSERKSQGARSGHPCSVAR